MSPRKCTTGLPDQSRLEALANFNAESRLSDVLTLLFAKASDLILRES